jgi:hypothetical protein
LQKIKKKFPNNKSEIEDLNQYFCIITIYVLEKIEKIYDTEDFEIFIKFLKNAKKFDSVITKVKTGIEKVLLIEE